jgi:hypothetical protein
VPWGCPGRPGKPSHGTSPFKQQPYKYGKSPILLNQDISIYIYKCISKQQFSIASCEITRR